MRDEILWEAKISPKSIAGKLPAAARKMLYESIGKVMLWAVTELKKTYPDMINGEVRDIMRVHNPLLEYTSDGELIHNEVISSKNTYFTDSQVNYY